MPVDRKFWRGKRVFMTGHTGFKGGWLATWLNAMGATVDGVALDPESAPSYFGLCGVDRFINSTIADIRDGDQLRVAMQSARPEIVFHLAAQSLVRRSYVEPSTTFATNVIGTVNLFEAIRATPSVRAVVVVTSDKCYENGESARGFRETDMLGGYDPYSASKACAEIVAAAYRRSFFSDRDVFLATARAGNVIGGGDWAEDRIVPDALRAFGQGEVLTLRNPRSVRPWQHVLEPLAGYLELATRLYTEGAAYSGPWNFGPGNDDAVTVAGLIDKLAARWGDGARWRIAQSAHSPHEHEYLKLDCSKANRQLGWHPRLNLDAALQMTVDWYREATSAGVGAMDTFSRKQIAEYERLGSAAINEIH